jgi:hypothetical protein
MTTVTVFSRTGEFAEKTDVARDIRDREILPALRAGRNVTIDFSGVNLATQPFVHVLLSAVIRGFRSQVVDKIKFEGCNANLKRIISIVMEYSEDPAG